MRSVNAEIVRRLDGDGLAIDGLYWCPHYDDGCECRKPEPGLLHRAVREHELTLTGAAMVGDRGSDIALAHGASAFRASSCRVRARTSAPNRICAPARCSKRAEWIVRRGH